MKNCFEDSPAFLQQFLHNANLPIPVSKDVKIYNRKGFGKQIDTPDMIIVIKDEKNHVFVIENKLGAAEGDAQTDWYYTDAAREVVKNHFEFDEHTHFYFIYLTLDTTVTPSEKRYAQVFYQQFLQGEWPLNDATLQLIFRDFQQTFQKSGYDLLVLTISIEANSLEQSLEAYSTVVKQLEVIIDEVIEEVGLYI